MKRLKLLKKRFVNSKVPMKLFVMNGKTLFFTIQEMRDKMADLEASFATYNDDGKPEKDNSIEEIREMISNIRLSGISKDRRNSKVEIADLAQHVLVTIPQALGRICDLME